MSGSFGSSTSEKDGSEQELDSPAPRNRNVRGEGNKLRDDIVEAARKLLERTGTKESVTLRAIAREIGIAAPSIYRHFPDRDAIVKEVESRTYRDLEHAIETAAMTEDDAVEQLVAGCFAYVEFALENPGRYRILFNQLTETARAASPDGGAHDKVEGLNTFQILVAGVTMCITSGQSKSTDAWVDSTNIWTALHGIVTLRISAEMFPWQPLKAAVRDVVCTLGRIS